LLAVADKNNLERRDLQGLRPNQNRKPNEKRRNEEKTAK
jgi:hypothetical protein